MVRERTDGGTFGGRRKRKEEAPVGKRVENLKENRKKGISMAIVLCVSAFFLAFAAAIVYTAGLLTAEANARLEQERCYQLAKSYAKVLDTELTSYTRKTEENSTTFYGFASRFLDGRYAEYDPGNQDNTVFYYQPVAASMPDPKYGTIKIALYKETGEEDNTDLLSGTLPAGSGNYREKVREVENYTIMQYILTVEVIASYGDSSYTYSTEYYRKERYPASFSHNGTVLVWNDENWHEGNTGGTIYDMSQITEDTPVKYTLDKSQAKETVFEPVYEEAGHE